MYNTFNSCNSNEHSSYMKQTLSYRSLTKTNSTLGKTKLNIIPLKYNHKHQLTPLQSPLISEFKNYFNHKLTQLTLLNKHNKRSSTSQTLLQFYKDSQNEMNTLSTISNRKDSELFRYYAIDKNILEEYIQKNNHSPECKGYFINNKGNDKQMRKLFFEKGIKETLSRNEKEELIKQGSLRMFKQNGNVCIENSIYKNHVKSYRNLLLNKQIENNMFIENTEKQISRYMLENNKNIMNVLRASSMPKIKVYNLKASKLLLKQSKTNKDKNKITDSVATNIAVDTNIINNQDKINEYKHIHNDSIEIINDNPLDIPRQNYFNVYNTIIIETNNRSTITPSSRCQAQIILHSEHSSRKKTFYMFGGICQGKTNEMWKCTFKHNPPLRKQSSDNDDNNNNEQIQLQIQKRKELKFKWEKINIKGNTIPARRTGHTISQYRDKLFIYGGIFNENETYENKHDILIYNTLSKTFDITNLPKNKPIPSWRRNHICETMGFHMVIYGGIEEEVESSGKVLNDIWSLSLYPVLKWSELKTVGHSLPYLHSMNSCMVIPSSILNSPHHSEALNPKKKINNIKDGKSISDYCNIKSIYYGIYVFGGIDNNAKYSNKVYHIRPGKVITVSNMNGLIKGVAPCERAFCSVSFYERLNVIVVFGGRNQHCYFNDFWFLDLMLFQWSLIQTNVKLSGRAEHCCVIDKSSLIIFGGSNGRFYHKGDIVVAHLNVGGNYFKLKEMSYDNDDNNGSNSNNNEYDKPYETLKIKGNEKEDEIMYYIHKKNKSKVSFNDNNKGNITYTHGYKRPNVFSTTSINTIIQEEIENYKHK